MGKKKKLNPFLMLLQFLYQKQNPETNIPHRNQETKYPTCEPTLWVLNRVYHLGSVSAGFGFIWKPLQCVYNSFQCGKLFLKALFGLGTFIEFSISNSQFFGKFEAKYAIFREEKNKKLNLFLYPYPPRVRKLALNSLDRFVSTSR